MPLSILTTYASTRPGSLVIATLIALCYLGVAGGRWAWSMLPDAALLALYVWRPSLPLLAFVLLLVAVRHTPTLAREVAAMFQLHTFEGWTIRAVVFALPALKVYSSHTSAPAQGAAIMPPLVSAQAAQAAPAPVERATLSPAQWLGAVNDDATAPHLGVVGPTRLGKTTFVLAALGRRAGRVVVTTPKSQDVDPWGGAQAYRLRFDLVGRSVDWTPIRDAIGGVHFEMLQRNATNTARDAERITLTIDELSTTLANCGARTKQQILELLNMGAGANIRLIVADPEVNARAWGVEGRRDILGNLIFARVEDGRRWSIGRLDPNGRLVDPQTCDTTPMLALSRETVLAGREWAAPPQAHALPPADPLLAGLLGAGVPVPGGETPPQGAISALGTGNGTGTEPGTPIVVLRALRERGMTREQARAIGCKFRDTDWTEAGKKEQP